MMKVIGLDPTNVCPKCGHKIDDATYTGSPDYTTAALGLESGKIMELEERSMRPGDFSVCFYCSCLLRFIEGDGKGLKVRMLTDEEFWQQPKSVRAYLRQAQYLCEESYHEKMHPTPKKGVGKWIKQPA